jgi:cyclopropane-fatty-acyl-phospholipid synthase
VIAHHYDLSNRLYEVLLDPTMAYSCAYWTSNAPEYSLADAQRDKLDLICRKLDLRPGARLLDIGCGWGALALHAASRFGSEVTGITLSARQREVAQIAIDKAGLGDRVTIQLSDYRDLPGELFDAVAVVEMGEHVGKREYGPFINRVAAALVPSGRLLVQQMSRTATAPGGGAFIERYIASDMHMQPISRTLAAIEDAGLEVRDVHALREHYVRTIDAWAGELDRRRSDAEAVVGSEWVRVWRLYLAGSALAFEQNRMGVDQILAVKTEVDGRAGLDQTRSAWEATRPGCAVG